MSPRLAIHGLHLQRGGKPVLSGVELRIGAGELVGLVGPNGAGKSSLLQCIAGSLSMDAGQIAIDGHALPQALLPARRALGFAVEPERLPAALSGRQCLELLADLRGVADALPASLALADSLQLTPWLEQPVRRYSLGTRQKLAIVLALLGTPTLIVLDEVLNGLDPLAAYALKAELRARADAGAAVLLATHGLEVAERFLDRAVLLLDGRIVADWDRATLAAFRADPDGGLEHAVADHLRAHAAGRESPTAAARSR